MKPSVIVNTDSVRKALRRKIISTFGTQKQAAEYFNVSAGFISMVLCGQKMPTKEMCAFVNAHHIDMYVMQGSDWL